MPSQHKHRPISVRLPEDDRAWVLDTAEAQDRAVNAVIVEAVQEKRALSGTPRDTGETKENDR